MFPDGQVHARCTQSKSTVGDEVRIRSQVIGSTGNGSTEDGPAIQGFVGLPPEREETPIATCTLCVGGRWVQVQGVDVAVWLRRS